MFETKLIILDTIPMSVGKSCPPNLTANFFSTRFPQQHLQQYFQQVLDKFATIFCTEAGSPQQVLDKLQQCLQQFRDKFATRFRRFQNCPEHVRANFATTLQQDSETTAARKKTSLHHNCGEILILLLWQAKTS